MVIVEWWSVVEQTFVWVFCVGIDSTWKQMTTWDLESFLFLVFIGEY
jgi:hypothetical protein